MLILKSKSVSMLCREKILYTLRRSQCITLPSHVTVRPWRCNSSSITFPIYIGSILLDLISSFSISIAYSFHRVYRPLAEHFTQRGRIIYPDCQKYCKRDAIDIYGLGIYGLCQGKKSRSITFLRYCGRIAKVM